jgi:hypothetical protein
MSARPASRAEPSRAEPSRASLRAWLEYVASTAIDWLDELDAQDADLEDDQRECDREWAP